MMMSGLIALAASITRVSRGLSHVRYMPCDIMIDRLHAQVVAQGQDVRAGLGIARLRGNRPGR